MASGGSDLSTRTSSGNQNRSHMQDHEAALEHFRKCKIEISDAIQRPFPFFGLFRDHGFITKETYEESRRKWISAPELAYDVLTKLEETFDQTLLRLLFSKVMMKNYPNLKCIYKSFRDVIRDKSFLPEIADEEMEEKHASQPNVEQGTGGMSLQILPWRGPDLLNSNVTSSNLSESSEREDTHEVTRSGPQIAPGVSSGEEARPESSQASDMMDAMNVRNKSALQKAKGKKRSRTHPEEDVDFRSDVLPVTCGDAKGMLHKNKLSQGGTVKSIMKEDGKWFTPREFEVEGGHKNSSNWKQSVHCGGKTLKWLMEEGFLPQPPTTHGRKKKNADVCEICQDGGKLFCCDTCSRSFHEDCHIPRVETERSPWSCTFCIMASSRSRECHSGSEVLEMQMGPEEQLKCEFLLLKAYRHLEVSIFKKIPCHNYKKETSQCMKELMLMVSEIKKKLTEWGYQEVGVFVWDMYRIFEKHRACDKCYYFGQKGIRLEAEFEKHFKKVFAIRDAIENSSVV